MKTLYKKTSTGAMSVWQIHGVLEEATIYIEYGQMHGAMIKKTETVETNSSGRTLREQMILRIKSRISKQLAKGYRYTPDEAKQSSNLNELDLHKPMLAQPMGKVNTDLTDYWRQNKFDGHRMMVTNVGNGQLKAYSRNGKPITTLDHILEGIHINSGLTLDGEVYAHGYKLQEIASWCKRKQEKTLRLIYIVYDLVLPEPYDVRLDRLKALDLGPKCTVAPTWKSCAPILNDLTFAVEAGYEGLILRCPRTGYEAGKRSKSLVKAKVMDAIDDEFTVIDITPSKDGWAVLKCAMPGDKSFSVSAPGNIGEKREVLENKENYIGKDVQVQAPGLTKDGKPFHPVAISFRDKYDE